MHRLPCFRYQCHLAIDKTGPAHQSYQLPNAVSFMHGSLSIVHVRQRHDLGNLSVSICRFRFRFRFRLTIGFDSSTPAAHSPLSRGKVSGFAVGQYLRSRHLAEQLPERVRIWPRCGMDPEDLAQVWYGSGCLIRSGVFAGIPSELPRHGPETSGNGPFMSSPGLLE